MNVNNIEIGKKNDKLIRLTWGLANIYSSEEFEVNEGEYICFGALMRGRGFSTYGYNNGTVKLKIHKHLDIYSEGYSSILYVDNKLNFSIEEITEILDLLKQSFKVMDYSIEDEEEFVILNLVFKKASRIQILFILNICRRFYRFMLSVTLRIAYNIWKSNKYNLSLFELIFLIDNMHNWSMSDDLFICSELFGIKRINFNTGHRFNPDCLKGVSEQMNVHIFRNKVNSNLKAVDRLTKDQLKRSVKRNIENKFNLYNTYEKVYDAYVHYLSYYINKKLKEYKDTNCIE